MKVYVLINLETQLKDCVEGVYSSPEYAHFRAKNDLPPDTYYRVFEQKIEMPSAGFVSINTHSLELLGMFTTPKKTKKA